MSEIRILVIKIVIQIHVSYARLTANARKQNCAVHHQFESFGASQMHSRLYLNKLDSNPLTADGRERLSSFSDSNYLSRVHPSGFATHIKKEVVRSPT